MKKLCIALLTTVIATSSNAQGRAGARVSRPPTVSATCQRFAADYELASKQLAMNNARRLTERNAARREAYDVRDNNIVTRARMTMDLMRGNGCQAPTALPSATGYMTAALRCNEDFLSASVAGSTTLPESCDLSRWVRTSF